MRTLQSLAQNPYGVSAVMAGALALDLGAGDPPNAWHPVAWMGSAIGRMRKAAPTQGRALPFLAGGAIALGGAATVFKLAQLLEQLPQPLRFVVTAALLKSSFSLSGLVRAAGDVEAALAKGDLDEARKWVGWHLVSRDTSELNESQVVAATVESLAENLSDGVIAPLFYYQLAGLPGALAYRYLNTCDAMLGYRDAEREWLGKFPARLDDVANVLPARLTALTLWLAGGANRYAWRVYRRDRRQTDSPNAGHPMGMMAGVLGVELEKVGQYRLGLGLREPERGDIERAVKVLYGATGVCLGGFVFAAGWIQFKSPSPQPSPEGEGVGSGECYVAV